MMKKMWKMRKDKSAVSPVIATILMVAITVVLAAVLYVMVMGFGTGGGSTPTASMTATKTSSLVYNVTVQSVSVNTIKYTSLTVVCAGANSTAIMPALAGSTTLGAGDSFIVTATGPGPVTISLRDTATSNNVASITIQATA
ncbi:MAG TPA: type IV pilin N-terminal domain-containing protein [Methanomassiliicoccales archaeon]|jgi:flagellin-like protein